MRNTALVARAIANAERACHADIVALNIVPAGSVSRLLTKLTRWGVVRMEVIKPEGKMRNRYYALTDYGVRWLAAEEGLWNPRLSNCTSSA